LARQKVCPFLVSFETGSASHRHSCSLDTGVLSLVAKRRENEAKNFTASSAEFKNEWSYTSSPKNASMVWCLIKQDSFSLNVLQNNIQEDFFITEYF
jgi:hypothetical protein